MPFYDWTARIPFGDSEAAAASAAASPTILQVPVDSSPNQEFDTTLDIDGASLSLHFKFRYNDMAGYWVMTISDPATGEILLDSIPMITGADPYIDLLGQHRYLALGAAFLHKAGNTALDYPDGSNLGTDFLLIWSDTPS